MKSLTRFLLLFSLIALFSGCATMQEASRDIVQALEPDPGKEVTLKEELASTTKVPVQGLDPKKNSKVGGVEIVWQIPDHEVEGFLIKYGVEKEALNQKVSVESRSLEKFEDPNSGFVYRYVISGVPVDRNIFVQIQAYEGQKLSKPSRTVLVPPNTVQ